ncbi:MAG: glutathione S-transferase [Gammaproteobacteria bacterium]
MLKVWGRRNAFNVQKVMWLLAELGLPHEHIAVGGSYGGLDTPEFLAMNPHGRIPVISDSGTIVWESHAILRYLAAKYGQPHFWSEAAEIRAQSDQWMDWSQTVLQPDFLNGVFWGFYRTPEVDRNWSAIKESIERCTKHFILLNQILKNRQFLCGDGMTLADIPAGAILYRYFELEIERPIIPNVELWYRRLQERPAYQQHVMIAFSDMKGDLKR